MNVIKEAIYFRNATISFLLSLTSCSVSTSICRDSRFSLKCWMNQKQQDHFEDLLYHTFPRLHIIICNVCTNVVKHLIQKRRNHKFFFLIPNLIVRENKHVILFKICFFSLLSLLTLRLCNLNGSKTRTNH